MGKIVLAFDQTGPREILDHFVRFIEEKRGEKITDDVGKNPLLITPNNSMALAEKIGFLADHPEILDIFRPFAREFVEKNYSSEVTEKMMVKILEEV
jgi:glycosyltransferase involved in cell wall biosynthesis